MPSAVRKGFVADGNRCSELGLDDSGMLVKLGFMEKYLLIFGDNYDASYVAIIPLTYLFQR